MIWLWASSNLANASMLVNETGAGVATVSLTAAVAVVTSPAWAVVVVVADPADEAIGVVDIPAERLGVAAAAVLTATVVLAGSVVGVGSLGSNGRS